MKTRIFTEGGILIVVGLLILTLGLTEDACGGERQRDQQRQQTQTEDAVAVSTEDILVVGSGDCDCLCTCCQDCLCTCCLNCLCDCCLEHFCTSGENRLRVQGDESFRAQIENRFRFQWSYAVSAEETTGNCLSYPVIWADAVGKALRGDGDPLEVPRFWGVSVLLDEVDWYEQQDPDNVWQAGSRLWPGGVACVATGIDWGDNLEAKPWTAHSVVRVETVLHTEVDFPMASYEMLYLYGEGPDEMQGTNRVVYGVSSPTMYSQLAHLTIQKWFPESEDLVWNLDTGLWDGADEPIVSGNYSAEINVKGKVIFGYNWFVQRTTREDDDPTGLYRITMRFGDSNVDFVEGITSITQGGEVTATTSEAAEAGEEPGGGVAMIDFDNDLTYIDVLIISGMGGGGGGGGGGNRGDGGGASLVADFEGGPPSGPAPLTVFFDDTSTGKPQSWLWDFSDWPGSTEQNPVHTYQEPGTYTVRLTVAKGTQTDTETKYSYINVTTPAESGTTVHVEALDMSYTDKGPNHYVDTTVTLRDENNKPVVDATVELLTILPDGGMRLRYGTTGPDGTTTFQVKSSRDGEYISRVEDVTHASRTYAASDNDLTSGSLLVR